MKFKSRLIPFICAVLLMAMPALADNPAYDPVTMDLPSIASEFPPAIHEITFKSQGSRLPSILMTANGAGPHPTVEC